MRTIVKLSLCAFLLGSGTLGIAKTKDPQDPFESLNRQIFQFNYDLDILVYRPIASFYTKAVHPGAQKVIKNFFNNLDEIPSLANDILQLDGHHIVLNTWRFVINSTLGLLGTRDVASKMGLPPYKNDFGLTLYKWGIKETPYVQIIFLGPSTLRDAVGMGVDYPLKPDFYISSIPVSYSVTAFRGIPTRAELLAANKLVDEAIDPYVFVKDAYLQKRKEDIRKMRAHLKNSKETEEESISSSSSDKKKEL